MFINKLLLAFVFYNNGKIIKAAYQASDLEAVNEVDNYAKVFLSYMVQKAVLQIHSGFCIGIKKQSILLYQFYNKSMVWASGSFCIYYLYYQNSKFFL